MSHQMKMDVVNVANSGGGSRITLRGTGDKDVTEATLDLVTPGRDHGVEMGKQVTVSFDLGGKKAEHHKGEHKAHSEDGSDAQGPTDRDEQ